MPRPPLLLLATERHVERALGRGENACSWRSFLQKTTAALDLRAATPEITQLATALALESLRDELSWDASPSLARDLDDALGTLRRAGVDATTLERSPSARAKTLGRLLRRTDALLLEAHVFDDRSLGFVAASRIAEASTAELPSRVVIDGLFVWDGATCAWVEALARRVPVTVRMPRFLAGTTELTRAPDTLLSWLEGRWQPLSDAPDLELLEMTLPRRIDRLEAATDGAEARGIVRAIRDALDRGVSAEGIAVVLPSLDEPFLEPLRAAFDEARIPFAEPRGRPPTHAPVVRAALSWLDLGAAPLARDSLVDLLRSNVVDPAPFLDAPTWSERRRHALGLARRLERIPVGVDRDGTLLADVLQDEIERDSEDNWMVESLDRIVGRLRKLRVDAPRRDLAEMLTTTWQAMGLEGAERRALADVAASAPASAEAHLWRGLAREQAVGYRALLLAVSRVVAAAAALSQGDAPVSAARFRAEVEDALAGVSPEATQRAGAVRLVRVSEVARLESLFLVVARASEGVFEPAAPSNAILNDEVVSSLSASQRPPPYRRTTAAHRTALLAAIASSETVLVARSATDGDGRAAAAAPIFNELGEGRSVVREPASPLSAASRPLSARMSELQALGQGAPSRDLDIRRRVDIESDRLAFFLDPRRAATETSGAVALDVPLAAEHLREAFGGTMAKPIAATAIERAALCRFASFANRVLGASTDGGLGEELEPGQRGSLIHRALFLAFEAMRSERGLDDRAAVAARALEKAKGALLRERTSPLYRAEVLRALRDVSAVLQWSLADPSGFVFAYGERAFGESRRDKPREGRENREARPRAEAAPWPALAVAGGSSTFYVKGRIDRVDVAEGGSRARVIDYKTGAIPAWKDVGTLVFQPPLYAYAVMRQMGQLSLSEVRALYLDTGKRPPRMFPAAEKTQVLSAKQIDEAQRRAGQIVLRLWNGDVAPRPADPLVCGRCDVRDVCRRPAAMPIDDLDAENEGAIS